MILASKFSGEMYKPRAVLEHQITLNQPCLKTSNTKSGFRFGQKIKTVQKIPSNQLERLSKTYIIIDFREGSLIIFYHQEQKVFGI